VLKKAAPKKAVPRKGPDKFDFAKGRASTRLVPFAFYSIPGCRDDSTL
jgi:hypothetical protein